MNVLQMSISAVIIILVIVVIRALAIHKLPKKVFVVLWGMVVFRLLIPFYIPLPLGVHTLTNRSIELVSLVNTQEPSSATFVFLDGMPKIEDINAWVSIGQLENTTSVSVVVVIWTVSMAGVALFFIILHWRGRREYMSAIPIENDYVNKWLQEHKLKRPIQIRQSDRINAPLTYGVWNPVILFPKTFNWRDEIQLRYILTHELTHIRRFDVLIKWLLAPTLCVHWFNPLVWVMYILANRDVELACDETVVQAFGETTKSAYVLALIGLEESKSGLSLLCNNFAKNAIEERIRMIMKMQKRSVFGAILAVLLVSVITIGTLTANAQSPNEPDAVFVRTEAGYTRVPVNAIGVGDVVLIPPALDADDDILATFNSMYELQSWLAQETSSARAVMFDCCHSEKSVAFSAALATMSPAEFNVLEVGSVVHVYVPSNYDPIVLNSSAEFEATFGFDMFAATPPIAIPFCAGPEELSISQSFTQAGYIVRFVYDGQGNRIGMYLRCDTHYHTVTRRCVCGTSISFQVAFPGCRSSWMAWF